MGWLQISTFLAILTFVSADICKNPKTPIRVQSYYRYKAENHQIITKYRITGRNDDQLDVDNFTRTYFQAYAEPYPYQKEWSFKKFKYVPVCGGFETKCEICRITSTEDPDYERDVLAIGHECNEFLRDHLGDLDFSHLQIESKGVFYVSTTDREVEGTKAFQTEICNESDVSDWFCSLTTESETACPSNARSKSVFYAIPFDVCRILYEKPKNGYLQCYQDKIRRYCFLKCNAGYSWINWKDDMENIYCQARNEYHWSHELYLGSNLPACVAQTTFDLSMNTSIDMILPEKKCETLKNYQNRIKPYFLDWFNEMFECKFEKCSIKVSSECTEGNDRTHSRINLVFDVAFYYQTKIKAIVDGSKVCDSKCLVDRYKTKSYTLKQYIDHGETKMYNFAKAGKHIDLKVATIFAYPDYFSFKIGTISKFCSEIGEIYQKDHLTCAPCPPGYFKNSPNSCIACPRGFYQTVEGATWCMKCPASTNTEYHASDRPELCIDGLKHL